MSTPEEVETAVDALTLQTTNLLDTMSSIKDDVADDIAQAVIVSENAAIIPMFTISTNLININTTLINFIAGSQPE
jgi:hypothetical protein